MSAYLGLGCKLQGTERFQGHKYDCFWYQNQNMKGFRDLHPSYHVGP